MDHAELERLRKRAERLGVFGTDSMDEDQLREAIAERHRGNDPSQASRLAKKHER